MARKEKSGQAQMASLLRSIGADRGPRARNIVIPEKLSIVVIIDELADLMLVAR
jgi:DNA segregation ATPase FtsK/SpoIIIE-like protein